MLRYYRKFWYVKQNFNQSVWYLCPVKFTSWTSSVFCR
jgi:hypothetical protein